MRIALKYGLLVTVGVVAWLLVAHAIFPDPASSVHTVGPAVFFNLLEIVGIALGIKARQRESDGVLSFKSGLKAGVSIAAVYAVTTCLFFLVHMAVSGPGWLAAESRAPNQPLWQVAVGAFAGLLVGAIVLGLIYSTIITFFVVRAQSGRRYD